jgi:hypothetical protein
MCIRVELLVVGGKKLKDGTILGGKASEDAGTIQGINHGLFAAFSDCHILAPSFSGLNLSSAAAAPSGQYICACHGRRSFPRSSAELSLLGVFWMDAVACAFQLFVQGHV